MSRLQEAASLPSAPSGGRAPASRSTEPAASSLPVSSISILGLEDRGLVREGCRADLVVFDPERVGEAATYDSPRRAPAGMDRVFVNGTEVAARGELTGERPGVVIRD